MTDDLQHTLFCGFNSKRPGTREIRPGLYGMLGAFMERAIRQDHDHVLVYELLLRADYDAMDEDERDLHPVHHPLNDAILLEHWLRSSVLDELGNIPTKWHRVALPTLGDPFDFNQGDSP